jgi:hypothetical protein
LICKVCPASPVSTCYLKAKPEWLTSSLMQQRRETSSQQVGCPNHAHSFENQDQLKRKGKWEQFALNTLLHPSSANVYPLMGTSRSCPEYLSSIFQGYQWRISLIPLIQIY